MRWLPAIMVLASCAKGRVELGPVAQPFGMVDKVRFGMTVDEVKQAAPALKFTPEDRLAIAHPSNADYTVRFAEGRVSEIDIVVDGRKPAEVWRAWGPGTVLENGRHRYFDEARGVRADLALTGSENGFAATLAPYTPLAKMLDGPDSYSLLGTKILGRSLDAVVADLRAKHLEVERVKSTLGTLALVRGLPETEWSGLTGSGNLTASVMAGDDGRITGWTIGATTFDASAAVKQQVSDFYATKWGPPRKTQSGERVYGTMPWVKVDEQFVLTTISTEPQPM